MTVEPVETGSTFWVLPFWVLVLGAGFLVPGAAAQTPQARGFCRAMGPFLQR